MKPLKLAVTAACIAALAIVSTAQAKKVLPHSWRFVRTIPIIIEPVVVLSVPSFWGALAAVGVLVDVLEEMCEPLENHDAGIYSCLGQTSATISWPDLDYPTRDIFAERSYLYNITTREGRWWIKRISTSYPLDSDPITEVTYSTEPPVVQDFCMMDIHYARIGLSGAHQSSFSFDAFETLTGYCARRGHMAYPRPVMAIFTGWNFAPLWRNDILHRFPQEPYESKHYVLLGPGNPAYALFKLESGEPNAEVNAVGVTTLYGNTQ